MISIAMTTYNGEKYLREQLDSILTQTFQDFELIICDDCSKDSTVQILNEYAARDNRVKVFVNEQNLGFKKNFEKAVGLCSGEYIALSDQDDIWYEKHLEILVKNLEGYSVSCGNADLVDSNNSDMHKKIHQFEKFYYPPIDKKKLLYRILLNSNPFQGASMLMTATFAKGVFPIPSKVRYHDAWISACACMENGINFTYDSVTRYRQHGDNVSSDKIKVEERRKSFSSMIARPVTFLKMIFKQHEVYSDRFAYCDELMKKYDRSNEDFNRIALFYKHVENGKITVDDAMFYWRNFKFINTSNSHKGYLKKLFIGINSKPYND